MLQLKATDRLPSGPPKKLRRLNVGALSAISNSDVAESLKSRDLQNEEQETLNKNDDFEVCPPHSTESDIGSHSNEGHPQEESKIIELPSLQKSIGESKKEKKRAQEDAVNKFDSDAFLKTNPSYKVLEKKRPVILAEDDKRFNCAYASKSQYVFLRHR
jgi:hypothetical protein